MALIVKLFTTSTSSSNLSRFSLVDIVFECFICVLDAWLNASAVMLLAPAIDYSSMNLRIAS